MFSNFKDAFIRRPQFTVKTPDAVVQMISKGLPDGFRYVHDHDGFCRLECDGVMNIMPAEIKLPPKAKSVFGEGAKVSLQEAMEYAYNAQIQIEFLPDDEDCYTINGQKIKRSELIIAPLKGLEFIGGQVFVVPPEFPDPFPVDISGNGYSLTLMIQRQPVNSLNLIQYSSVGNAPISVDFSFDLRKEDSIQFEIHTNVSHSAMQTLISKEIFNAIILGKGMFNGFPLLSSENNKDKKISEETLRFWHRVVDVEHALGIEFDVAQEINIDDIKLIDALYRSLVEKKPYKKYLKNMKFGGIGSFEDAKKAPKGKEIMFEITEEVSIELLGASMNLFSIVSVFNCKISEIQIPPDGKSGGFSLELIPAEEMRMFSSTQYYLCKETVEKIHADKTHIDDFLNADELEKY